MRKGRIMKVYYAHMYTTPKEVRDREILNLQVEFGIDNVVWHNEGDDYDAELLANADIVFVTGYNNGLVGKGVWEQVKFARDSGIPIWQLGERVGKRAAQVTGGKLWDTDNYNKYAQLIKNSSTWTDVRSVMPDRASFRPDAPKPGKKIAGSSPIDEFFGL